MIDSLERTNLLATNLRKDKDFTACHPTEFMGKTRMVIFEGLLLVNAVYLRFLKSAYTKGIDELEEQWKQESHTDLMM